MGIKNLNIISENCLKRNYLMPARILWQTEGVDGAELLLKNTEQQPRMGTGACVKFSTANGKKAALLIDFGSEFSGGVSIVTRLGTDKQGAMVQLRFGESVGEALTPLGEKNACSHHSARDFCVPIPLLSCTEWAQTGFRFLYLEMKTAEVELELVSVHGVFTYRDVPYIGSFECSNHVLSEIYDTSAYTVHLNMQELLWDGVKRDRLVWIGDMHPEMLAIRSVFGYHPIIDECLRYVAETNPIPDWPNHMTTYGMWYLLILYDWYLYNGNAGLLSELKYYWLALLKQLLALVHMEGKILREEEFSRGFFFDWPTQGMNEASGAGVYALLAKTLDAGAALCRLTGEEMTAEECQRKRIELSKGGLHHDQMKQVVAMMNLAGHIPNEEAAKILTEGGGRGMSTFQSYYILKAAAKTAGTKEALLMLEEYYGGMLKAGATTFWEDFDLDWLKEGARIDTLLKPGDYDIHGDNGRFCYTGLRHSLCHGWSAGPAAFLAENVLGIEIQSPGCKVIKIHPDLAMLDWTRGSYPTPLGAIKVEAERAGSKVRTKIEAPKEITVVEM